MEPLNLKINPEWEKKKYQEYSGFNDYLNQGRRDDASSY